MLQSFVRVHTANDCYTYLSSQRKSKPMSDSNQRSCRIREILSSWYEAGHAVVSHVIGGQVIVNNDEVKYCRGIIVCSISF